MSSVKTPWKYLIPCLLLTAVALLPRIASAAGTANENAGETVRLMVKVDPSVAVASSLAAAPITAFADTSVQDEELAKVGWQVIEVDAAAAPQIISELQANQRVLEVTPDYPLELAWTPNDPSFAKGEQWSLDKMGVDVAWEFSSGETITVAVIDSGIDHTHPDLAGRIVPGYNFIDGSQDTKDLCGHGTHVAGIIAAATDNAVGIAGVAPHSVIMPIKVIGANCQGNYSRLMQGILYAVEHGVRVISITSGGSYVHSGLHDAIKYAREQGVLVAVAAGNRGNDLPFYPGSFAESFTVAGTDENDQSYAMTTFGPQIDIAAPAVGILSTYWKSDAGSTYAYMTGTSMATPHVAAVAALILSIDPKLSLADLEATLFNSAVDLGEPGWDAKFGWGRLTAWRAVAAVSPAAGNVRLGHFRVPQMAEFTLSSVAVTADVDSVELSWAQEVFDVEQSIVIYRAPVPVFEAAVDIAEVAAAATGAYSDTDVDADLDYYYWLVQADGDVEVAITTLYSAKLAAAPAAPVETEPVEPQEPEGPVGQNDPVGQDAPDEPVTPVAPVAPVAPRQLAMFIPLVQR